MGDSLSARLAAASEPSTDLETLSNTSPNSATISLPSLSTPVLTDSESTSGARPSSDSVGSGGSYSLTMAVNGTPRDELQTRLENTYLSGEVKTRDRNVSHIVSRARLGGSNSAGQESRLRLQYLLTML